jgi:hypothetical protein
VAVAGAGTAEAGEPRLRLDRLDDGSAADSPAPPASAEEMERLRRALAEVDD